MIRLRPLLAVVTMFAAAAGPVVAQQETQLCLRVEAHADVVALTDVLAVQEAIDTGEIIVTEVVACDGVAAPLASPSAAADMDTGA